MCALRSAPLGYALLAALALLPGCIGGKPACPPGAKLMGEPPPNGSEVWCEKVVGGKRVKDGGFILYWPNGTKMMEGAYRDGKQTGDWTTWYENGQRSAADHFINGIQQGSHVGWYANGVKSAEGRFEGGRKDGVWKRWDANGLRNWEEIYRNGVPVKVPPDGGDGGTK